MPSAWKNPGIVLALVDESVQTAGVGTYVLACVVVPHSECAEIRELCLSGGKFHFREAGTARKKEMLERIRTCRLLASAYVYRGLFPIGEEGARGFCLDQLLLDVRQWGAGELVFESRGKEKDHYDNDSILGALHRGAAPADLAYSWVPKDSDPMLRLVDAFVGAVRVNVTSTHGRFKRELDEVCAQVKYVR